MNTAIDPNITVAERNDPYQLVVVSAGASDPSSTRMLADRIADRVAALATRRDEKVITTVVDLRQLAGEISAAMVSQLIGPQLTKVVELLGQADGIIASSPVYKASASGLFTSFFQVLDNDLLIGKPVVLAATAGTTRHALVIDDQMRSLFAYLRTLAVPTAVFAASEDWNSGSLGSHIDRAAHELLALMESGFAQTIKSDAWQQYQHEYGSAGGTELGIDLNTDLMRLATGGASGSTTAQ